MKLHVILAAIAVILTGTFAAPQQAPEVNTFIDAVDELNLQALSNIEASFQASGNDRGAACTLSNAGVRKNWSKLKKAERKAYTDSVLCLTKKPSTNFDPKKFPGVKSRYDEFVAVHMQQTLTIHNTANFFAWHRYYSWAFEKALRDECGYKGYQPYWNWGESAANPLKSSVFDGSPWSLSGDGAYVEHPGIELFPGIDFIPPGKGGGCVKSGPFKDMIVNLGPIAPTLPSTVPLPSDQSFKYNPRCLKRDISQFVSSRWLSTAEIVRLITHHPTIATFQDYLEGDFPNNHLGVHAAGHFVFSGDPGGDIFISPGDPAFWVHHAMVDRVWWIWMNLGGEERRGVHGTITMDNIPESRNGTVEDLVGLGAIGGERKIKDFFGTMEKGLCYIYQ